MKFLLCLSSIFIFKNFNKFKKLAYFDDAFKRYPCKHTTCIPRSGGLYALSFKNNPKLMDYVWYYNISRNQVNFLVYGQDSKEKKIKSVGRQNKNIIWFLRSVLF